MLVRILCFFRDRQEPIDHVCVFEHQILNPVDRDPQTEDDREPAQDGREEEHSAMSHGQKYNIGQRAIVARGQNSLMRRNPTTGSVNPVVTRVPMPP